MPRLKLTGPNGEVKIVNVSEVPDEQQMQQIVGRVFGEQSSSAADETRAIQPPQVDQPLTGNFIRDAQQALRERSPQASAFERDLDIQEAKDRPGFGEFLSQAAGSARGEIGSLLDLGETFIKNPIQSSKKIAKAAKGLTKSDVSDFAVDLASDFGKTFGFDINRPGVGLDKFDIDVAINRWRDQPVGAIGDALIFTAAAKGVSAAATGGKKAGNKVAMHNAIKRSGPEIKDMAEAIAEAKAKAISRGAKIETVTPGESVALSADVIKEIPLKNLNSPEFPRVNSVQLSEHIFDVGRREGVRMNKALDKVSNETVNTGRLGETVKKQLFDEGFAETAKDAVDVAIEGAKGASGDVNIITPLNKQKLSQFLKVMDSGKQMSVKELKNTLDVIDDSINWITPRTSDNGLKIMRRAIRQELGNISPEYDKIASRISDRLTELGYVEKKVRRASKEGFLRNYKEKLGLEIAKSDERTQAFKKAMNIVGDESSAAALGRFELVDAWRAWNDLYDTNQQVFRFSGDARGRFIDKVITGVQQRARKLAPGFDLPSQTRRAAGAVGGVIRSGAKLNGEAARTVGRRGPVGVTLTEGLIEE